MFLLHVGRCRQQRQEKNAVVPRDVYGLSRQCRPKETYGRPPETLSSSTAAEFDTITTPTVFGCACSILHPAANHTACTYPPLHLPHPGRRLNKKFPIMYPRLTFTGRRGNDTSRPLACPTSLDVRVLHEQPTLRSHIRPCCTHTGERV